MERTEWHNFVPLKTFNLFDEFAVLFSASSAGPWPRARWSVVVREGIHCRHYLIEGGGGPEVSDDLVLGLQNLLGEPGHKVVNLLAVEGVAVQDLDKEALDGRDSRW